MTLLPSTAAGSVKSDDRNLTRGTRFNKNRIVSFVVASAQRIVAGHKIRFLLSGGKRHLFRRINGTSQSHIAGTCRPGIVVQKIAGNAADKSVVIVKNGTAGHIIPSGHVIADKVSPDMVYNPADRLRVAVIINGSAISERSPGYVVSDKISADAADISPVEYCTTAAGIVTDKVSADIVYLIPVVIIDRTAVPAYVVAQKIAADAADGTGIIKGSAVLTGLIADKITGNVFDPAAVIDSSAIAAGGGISNKITGNLVNRTVVINGAAGNVCDAADKIGIDFPGQGRLPGIVNFSACRTDIVILKYSVCLFGR